MNKTKLKQIIKEELETVLREEGKDELMQKYAAGYRLSDKMHQRIEKQYADARAKKAAKDKKARDLAFAKTFDRKRKKAFNQRWHRANPDSKGMDYDHKDKRFKPASENRAGTKNE